MNRTWNSNNTTLLCLVKLSKHENTVIATYRGSHWLIQRVPSSSSGWLEGGGGRGGGGREPLIWCLILTLNEPSSPTRPSHYVVGDIAGSEHLFRVPGTNAGHIRTRHYMCGYTHLSFSVSSNPTTFGSEKMVLKFIRIVMLQY